MGYSEYEDRKNSEGKSLKKDQNCQSFISFHSLPIAKIYVQEPKGRKAEKNLKVNLRFAIFCKFSYFFG